MLDDSPLLFFGGLHRQTSATRLVFIPRTSRSFISSPMVCCLLVISSKGFAGEDSSITTYAHEILTSYLRKE